MQLVESAARPSLVPVRRPQGRRARKPDRSGSATWQMNIMVLYLNLATTN